MKNIVSTILCLFNIVIIQVCNCSNTTRGHEYSHVLDYDGKTCTEDKILFRNSTPSSIVCSSLCTNDESCTGVYYKPEGGSCVGCSVSPLPAEAVLHDDPGTSYIHRKYEIKCSLFALWCFMLLSTFYGCIGTL